MREIRWGSPAVPPRSPAWLPAAAMACAMACALACGVPSGDGGPGTDRADGAAETDARQPPAAGDAEAAEGGPRREAGGVGAGSPGASTESSEPGTDEVPAAGERAGDGRAGPALGIRDAAGDALVGAPDSFPAFEPQPLVRIPAGTRIVAALDVAVSTDFDLPGGPVVATVAEAVTDRRGELLIPPGVKLLGRIEAVEPSWDVGEAPVIEIAFETLSALNAEWPVEGAVFEPPVTLEPLAEARRRSAPTGSRAGRAVAGEIVAGSVLVVELQAAVSVGLVLGPDSVTAADTLPAALGSGAGGG